jgi:hypothetical protein
VIFVLSWWCLCGQPCLLLYPSILHHLSVCNTAACIALPLTPVSISLVALFWCCLLLPLSLCGWLLSVMVDADLVDWWGSWQVCSWLVLWKIHEAIEKLSPVALEGRGGGGQVLGYSLHQGPQPEPSVMKQIDSWGLYPISYSITESSSSAALAIPLHAIFFLF